MCLSRWWVVLISHNIFKACKCILPTVLLITAVITQISYMLFNCVSQIDASSLISASVMAAPCALAISKLSYPETEESRFKSKQNIKVASGYVHNWISSHNVVFSFLCVFGSEYLGYIYLFLTFQWWAEHFGSSQQWSICINRACC